MVFKYEGPDQYAAFLEASDREHEQACGVISPGGAAILLRVCRQRVYQLLAERDDIRAWAYFDDGGQRAAQLDVSVRDLVRYGVERGRMTPADYGFFSSRVEHALSEALRLQAQLSAVREAFGIPPVGCQVDTLVTGR